jgi:hypothetical protein
VRGGPDPAEPGQDRVEDAQPALQEGRAGFALAGAASRLGTGRPLRSHGAIIARPTRGWSESPAEASKDSRQLDVGRPAVGLRTRIGERRHPGRVGAGAGDDEGAIDDRATVWCRDMTIRLEPDGYGQGGTSRILTEPADLAQLAPKLARRVPPEVADVFRRFPASVRERAAACSFEPCRAWLDELASMRCELEVHDPRGWEGEVMVRFRPEDEPRTHRGSDRSPWSPAILPRQPAELPPGCPAMLRAVYEAVGGVNLGYGSSGSMPHPRDVKSAEQVIEEIERWGKELFGSSDCLYRQAEDLAEHDLDRCFQLWEADGDHLLWTPHGRTFWMSVEHGMPTGVDQGSVEEALERIFSGLRQRRWFPF